MTSPFPPANLPPQSRAWKKAVEGGLKSINLAITSLTARVNNSLLGVNASIRHLQQVIDAQPIFDAAQNTVTGISAGSSGWVTKASVTLTVPSGKSSVVIGAQGSIQVIDSTTGGVAVADGRIVINGTAGPDTGPAKDAGASVVRNIINVVGSGKFTVTPGQSITVAVQVNPSNPSAFATAYSDNFATVVAQATYF